mmetsp:Transcript_8741/g.12138  ORF Transcript_8741/g.12138 Transcript_8741/m.12138 type:complete len:226 (+) Transcript_8741:630-1307(+)
MDAFVSGIWQLIVVRLNYHQDLMRKRRLVLLMQRQIQFLLMLNNIFQVVNNKIVVICIPMSIRLRHKLKNMQLLLSLNTLSTYLFVLLQLLLMLLDLFVVIIMPMSIFGVLPKLDNLNLNILSGLPTMMVLDIHIFSKQLFLPMLNFLLPLLLIKLRNYGILIVTLLLKEPSLNINVGFGMLASQLILRILSLPHLITRPDFGIFIPVARFDIMSVMYFLLLAVP